MAHDLDGVGLDDRHRLQRRFRKRRVEVRPDHGRTVGNHQRIVDTVAKPDLVALGERMVRRHHRAEFAGGPCQHLQMAATGKVEADAEIGFTTGDRGLDVLARGQQGQMQAYPRVGGAELLDGAGHQI